MNDRLDALTTPLPRSPRRVQFIDPIETTSQTLSESQPTSSSIFQQSAILKNLLNTKNNQTGLQTGDNSTSSPARRRRFITPKVRSRTTASAFRQNFGRIPLYKL
jgi:hypothetical protein